MDYLLHNSQTGDARLLDPPWATVGSAPYVTLRTADGPHLAALVVRYPAGWVVHGLSDDPGVLLNRTPLGVNARATPWPGDELVVGQERLRFVSAAGKPEPPRVAADPPPCFAYVRYPDGMEECRAVDHDLLFGRRSICHVHLNDKRLSRLSALLASHAGKWYLHALAQCPVSCNGDTVEGFTPIDDGDELRVGPLVVRVELRVPQTPAQAESQDSYDTEIGPATDDGIEPPFQAAALALDNWLRRVSPATTTPPPSGLSRWFGAQRNKLQRFWYDTPDATAARAMRSAGKVAEAFALLDKAIRARPDSPQLLRELYRLYDSQGMTDLCYRPLRQIEKLADGQGGSDAWVLEALARVCERLADQNPGMLDRAVTYWNKVEAATGVSRARERSTLLASRALRANGFKPTDKPR